jgi:D-alanyl-D-alanine carboxypeptidase
MLRAGVQMRRGLRWGAMGLAALLGATAISNDADARARRSRHSAAAAEESYDPAYSSIVMDANSGAVMQGSSPDSPRHPASLTKIMTLFLLFERLEAGSMKLSTEMPTSARAAAQAPSKLGLKPGETIKVEIAIRAIVTKSANDVAVMVAEAIGGDEINFAKMMTDKARALGMHHTLYRNASGLPEPQQITTARDQAILGRAIQDRFPQYYKYFSTQNFEFRGKETRNHNHLLGSVDGVDGIKTGYIRESGFNIVTSVRRSGRHIIAVVFGGRSAEARDVRVRALIDSNINVAAVKRTAPPIVEGWETAEAKNGKDKVQTASAAALQAPPSSNAAPVAAVAPDPQAPAPGSTDPIKPNTVKTVTVQPGIMRTAALSPLPSDSRKLIPAPASANPISVTNILTVKGEAPPPVTANPAKVTMVAAVKSEPLPPATPPPPSARPGLLSAKVASAGNSVPVAAAAAEPAAKPRGGWMIQVGAFDDEKEAKERLTTAQDKAKNQLGKADPFTERTTKGDKAMYRARFAGLDKDQAETACKNLKRSEIPCMLLKN